MGIEQISNGLEYKNNIKSDKNGAEIFDLDQRKNEMESKEVEKNYADIFDFRRNRYRKDLEMGYSSEIALSNLEVHNGIALNYVLGLLRREKLSPEDRVAAIIAIIMHDSGKLSSKLLDHHKKSVEYADEMFREMEEYDPEFDGIKLNDSIRQKIFWAIERHMNHPYLVKMADENNEEKLPLPENNVDRVVNDADMLANIGFKNVAFRLTDKKYIEEDFLEAVKNNRTIIEEVFINVMEGVVKLDGAVLLSSAQELAKKRITEVKKIFNYLKKNRVFENILEEVEISAEKLKEDRNIVFEKAGLIKEILNRKIKKAGEYLHMDSRVVGNFLM